MRKNNESEVKTIIIADDHPLLAQGLLTVIHEFTPYKVVALVPDGKALLHKLNSKQPDMVLLDINMPRLNGIEAAQEIKKRFPKVRIVIISMYGEEALNQLKNKVEVEGYISKLSPGEVFTKTIMKVMEGSKVFIKSQVTADTGKVVSDNFQIKMKLTERELEILRLIKKGLTTKAISLTLNLSPHTITTHRKKIGQKLDITTQNGLAKFAFENEF